MGRSIYKLLKNCIYILLLFLLAGLGTQPALAAGENSGLMGKSQNLFDASDGLPATASLVVTQCEKGYLWVGGYGGLSRYDGSSFQTFEAGKLSNVDALLCGGDGTLWIGSSDMGLISYSNDTFTYLAEGADKEHLSEIKCLTETPDGTVYFGTEYGIGCVDENGSQNLLNIPQVNDQMVDDMDSDDAGILFCVTKKGSLYCVEGTDYFEIPLGDDSARSVSYLEETDTFYVGTTGDRIYLFHNATSPTGQIECTGLNNINDVAIDAYGQLIITADDGIAIVKDGRVSLQKLSMDNSVEDILVDNEGNYWFASSRQGVLLIRKGAFFDISKAAGLSDLVVNAQILLGDTLYIGHDEGLLALDAESYEQKENELTATLQDIRIRDLYQDSEGNLWICSSGNGLYCQKADGEICQYDTKTCPALSSDKFRFVYEYQGDILAATDAGVYRIHGDQLENLLTDETEVSCRVLSIASFEDHIILGTDGYGLYIVRDGQVTARLYGKENLTSNSIMKIYPSAEGRLWLVTGNGLSVMDKDFSVTPIEDFPSSNVLDILQKEDRLYILTGEGIYVTEEESLLLKDAEPVYEIYDYADGLCYDMTANARNFFDGDILYLCGNYGACTFDTAWQPAGSKQYELHFDYLTLDGEKIYIGNKDSYTIPAGTERIEVDANVVTYDLTRPDVYYYLEGYENSETTLSAEDGDDIHYVNLPGGIYTLHFGLKSPATGSDIQEITFRIRKEYKTREHAWFYPLVTCLASLVAVGLILLCIGIFSQLKKRKEKQYRLLYMDPLTESYNRRFYEEFHEKWEDISALVMIDLDSFKYINDNYGHLAGDEALKAAARVIQTKVRKSDLLIRFGGDEFLLIFAENSGPILEERLEQIRQEVEKLTIPAYPDLHMSLSMGAVVTDRCDDERIEKADKLLYEAKAVRNCIRMEKDM